MLLVSYVCLLA